MKPPPAKDVSAFHAKTHLSELLRETERGSSYIIRRRGKPVARLLPPEPPESVSTSSLVAELGMIRGRVKGKLDVLGLIEEGRRL